MRRSAPVGETGIQLHTGAQEQHVLLERRQ
jgi:hypothetical protein